MQTQIVIEAQGTNLKLWESNLTFLAIMPQLSISY